MLSDIRSAISKKNFSPEDYKHTRIRERKFEHKIDDWLIQKREEVRAGELSPGTLKDYNGYVNHHFLPFFTHKDVREIRFEDLENFKDYLGMKKLSIKTRKNIVNALHAFFNWLRRKGVITEVPVFPIIRGDDSKVRIAIDYDAQSDGLNMIPENHRDVCSFTFETGLRSSETCALKIGDIDVIGRRALIQRTVSGSTITETTKGRNKRWIPLSDLALELAIKHRRDKLPDAFLFINPETGRRYTAKKLNQVWKAYSGTDTTFYEASRHSFCTQLIEDGVDIAVVKELARHADIRTTQKYLHIRTSKLHDVVNRRGQVVHFQQRKRSES